jgi:hypothetical protein
MIVNLMCLALSTAVGAIPTSPARCAVTDSEPVLTVDALARMTAFWAAFTKEPDSIKTVGRRANQKQILVSVMGQQMPLPSVVNMVAMASKYPPVAKDLKRAGLTASQWEQYRKVLLTATLDEQIVKIAEQAGGLDSTKINDLTTAEGPTPVKNVAFLHAHQKEFDALKATGMWFPQFPAQGLPQTGGDAGDLNP